MNDPLNELLKSASDTVRKSFHSREWWKFVQNDVKSALDILIENIGTFGLPFRKAFRAFCDWEKAKLLSQGEKMKQNPSVLFRTKMSESAFQSGIVPTRAVLGLDDWSRPNEADVFACLHLCEQIDLFDSMGLFTLIDSNFPNNEKTDTDSTDDYA